MAKGMRWKSTEDLILVKTITDFLAKGFNIQEAFSVASDKLGDHRSEKACYSRWHSYLKDIYGDAVKLAVEKQKEHANKIVSSMLKINNSPAIPLPDSKVEILPLSQPTMNYPLGDSMIPPASSTDINIHDVISYLTNFQTKYEQLKKDHDDLLEELDRVWNENEALKLEKASFYEMNEKFDKLREIAAKLESVSA